jgi:3-methyladenine DNA glycosylase AlkD
MRQNQRAYLALLEDSLRRLAKSYPAPLLNYYNTGYLKLAEIPTPILRAFPKSFDFQSTLNQRELREFWFFSWHESEIFEVLSLALYFFEKEMSQYTLKDWHWLKKLVNKVDNWAHSDGLSKIYAHLYQQGKEQLETTYEEWNNSKNPWQRRQSLVGMLYYSNLRKKNVPPFFIFKRRIMALLMDDHFYVRKGLGWTLREMYNIYPEETYRLLLKIAKKLPAEGWQAASEKLSVKDKKRLIQVRRS